MGRRDYSKFSKHSKKSENNQITTNVKENDNEIVTNINSEESQSKTTISTDGIVSEIVNKDYNRVTGFLTGCSKLYLRKEPNKESKPLCVLDETTEFEIDISDHTTGDFCKVYTVSGIEGYCMKKFICAK